MPMDSEYYSRNRSVNSDGTPLYCADADISHEREVACQIEKAWGCELHAFGKLCPVDYYAVRDGRFVGVVEIKSRSHSSDKYPTVFINVRKWLSLMLCHTAMGCPAVYVVKFTDVIRWIDVNAIDARAIEIGGCRQLVKSSSDIEPVVHVEISSMKALGRSI